MAEHRPGFWSTLPGILTGTAAVITAVTGGYLAFVREAPQQASDGNTPQQTAMDGGTPTSAAAEHPREVRATVVDPDGWTNLRSGPSTSAQVVGQVREGETFWTQPSDGLWWRARTDAGLTGYVHRSRIRLNP